MSELPHHDVIVIGGGPAGSTVARYAAANGADVLVIDGRDPIATLAGEAGSPQREFYYQYRNYSAMRRGRYKLIQPAPEKPFELYDLREDTGESDDLAADKPRLTAELQVAFEKWFGQFEP